MKTVLITGASSGIGKETAYVYAENGFNLVLVARRKDRLQEIQKDLEEKHRIQVDIITQDLSTIESADELHTQVLSAKLDIDLLINNAGFGINGKFIDADISTETNMMMLNIVSLTKLTKLFALDMVKKGSGHIINIASTAAFQPVPNFAVYAATKSYVLNFSEAIAHELKDKNVIVSVVCPGATQSEFATVSGANESHFKKGPTSRELGEFIYETMTKNTTQAIHGIKNKFLVFSQRFSPRKMIVSIAAKMMEK